MSILLVWYHGRCGRGHCYRHRRPRGVRKIRAELPISLRSFTCFPLKSDVGSRIISLTVTLIWRMTTYYTLTRRDNKVGPVGITGYIYKCICILYVCVCMYVYMYNTPPHRYRIYICIIITLIEEIASSVGSGPQCGYPSVSTHLVAFYTRTDTYGCI